MEELPEDADLTVDPEHSQGVLPDKTSNDTPTSDMSRTTPTAVESSPPIPSPAMMVQEPSPPAQDKETLNPEQSSAVSEESAPAEAPVVTDVNSSQPPQETPAPQQTSDERRSSETSEQSQQRDRTLSTSSEDKVVDRLGTGSNDFKYATLSRVRKFKVDNQVMQSTTKKIVDVTANRTLRDNKKYQQMRQVSKHTRASYRIFFWGGGGEDFFFPT